MKNTDEIPLTMASPQFLFGITEKKKQR